MKKIVLFLMMMLPMAVMGQEESSHLTFKGVPIDGTRSEFVQKLKQKGFTLIGTEDGATLLKGDFSCFKGCLIGVTTLQKKDLVNKIAVILPGQETWQLLSKNYFDLKDMLTEKYGKPDDVIEEFQGYFEPESDNSKMHAVKMGDCKYITTFKTPKGTIQLTIQHFEYSKDTVALLYFDKINTETVMADAMDDL